MNNLDRYRGCLLGLAVGDALGTTLEFKRPGTFKPISDMVGRGPFDLKPGQWTDDTSMFHGHHLIPQARPGHRDCYF
jgi:ADP-ribosylglycohydrolase